MNSPINTFFRKIVEHWERKNVRCVAAIVNLSAEKLYYENGLGIPYLTDSVVSLLKIKNIFRSVLNIRSI